MSFSPSKALLFGEETIALPGGNDSFAPRKAIVFAEVLGHRFLGYTYCTDYQYFAFTLKERRNSVKISASLASAKCDIWNTFQTLHKGHTTSVALFFSNDNRDNVDNRDNLGAMRTLGYTFH